LVFRSILYFFLLTIFFRYVVQFQTMWKLSSMYPTCLEEWFQRSTINMDNFSCKCHLVKCSYLIFCRTKKKFFVNSNTNILQSTRWKFLKFFLHLFKPSYCKILWLHLLKSIFFQKFGTCTRNGSFWAYLVKT